MAAIKWSMEKLQSTADKFTNRTEFAKGDPAAYSTAARRKVLDDICGHMIAKIAPRFTDEELAVVASRYNHVIDFRTACPSHYQAAHSRGLTKQICAHMTAKKHTIDYPAYFAKKWGDKYIALSPYVTSKTRIDVECRTCGNTWSTIPFRIRCRNCGLRIITVEQHDTILANVHGGNITRINEYKGKAVKTIYQCGAGHTWNALAGNVLNGSGCPQCSVSGPSGAETQLADAIETYGFPIIRSDRTVIAPLELDVYVPSRNLAVEFNGSYWHSRHPRGYHLNKTKMCEQRNIRLIHVWEHEANNQLMMSIIASALGCYTRSLEARKCRVTNLKWSDTATFLSEHHIQGAGAMTPTNIGLIYNDEIVAVMTFGHPRFDKNHDIELVRYACAKHTRITGGAARLWSRRPSGSIVTYSDRRLFDGALYARLGFTRSHASQPGYFYTNSKGEVLHRYQTQRKRLPVLLGDRFDTSLSETDNMAAGGWRKIWDCGTVSWSYRPV